MSQPQRAGASSAVGGAGADLEHGPELMVPGPAGSEPATDHGLRPQGQPTSQPKYTSMRDTRSPAKPKISVF